MTSKSIIWIWVVVWFVAVGMAATELPPIPVVKKRARPASQGAGAQKLTVKSLPIRSKTITLSWDYDGSNVMFNVRCCKTNNFAVPSTNWTIITNTEYKSATFPIDTNAYVVWFTVTAIDRYGQWSGPARNLKLK